MSKTIELGLPTSFPIKNIIEEAKDIKTYEFDVEFGSKPGQFVMLWIPGVDEIPVGVAYERDGKSGVLVCEVGEATKVLAKKKVGDYLGIRGPAGTEFRLGSKQKKVVMVAGGYGVSPLNHLAEEINDQTDSIDFIYGARCDGVMALRSRLESLPKVKTHYATDDGTCGIKGYSTDILEDLMKKNKYDVIYTVGPEPMMAKVVEIATAVKVPVQLSLARWIKCAFGVCGQCAVDDKGLRMCVNGPVISGALAKSIPEFGKYFRDASGKKVKY